MKFSDREDIEAPIEHVWSQVSDFGFYERQALRRGADVRRVDQGPVRQGSGWDVAFTFRGKDRRLQARLSELDAPNLMRLDVESQGIDAVTLVELVPLAPGRTRLAVSIEMSAKSLSARLLLQSLKLAKANLTRRFKRRVADFAQEIEARYKPGA